MKKEALQMVEGTDIYSMISLIIFFVLFLLVIVFVMTMRKKDVEEVKNIPLNDNALSEKIK